MATVCDRCEKRGERKPLAEGEPLGRETLYDVDIGGGSSGVDLCGACVEDLHGWARRKPKGEKKAKGVS